MQAIFMRRYRPSAADLLQKGLTTAMTANHGGGHFAAEGSVNVIVMSLPCAVTMLGGPKVARCDNNANNVGWAQ